MARQTSAGLAGESGSEDEVAFDVHAEKFGFGAGVDATGAVVDGTDERDGGERVSTVVVGGDGFGEVLDPEKRTFVRRSMLIEKLQHGFARCRYAVFPIAERSRFATLGGFHPEEVYPELIAKFCV